MISQEIYKKEKPIYIPFTGGFDSTYLLLNIMRNIQKEHIKLIKPIYVSHRNNPKQSEKEVDACKIILNEINKNLGLKVLVHNYDISCGFDCDFPLQQPIRLLFPIYLYAESDSTIIFSHIYKDDYFLHREKINHIVELSNSIIGKNIEVINPLYLLHKQDIIHYIVTNNPELLNYIEFIEYDSNDVIRYNSKSESICLEMINYVLHHPNNIDVIKKFMGRFHYYLHNMKSYNLLMEME